MKVAKASLVLRHATDVLIALTQSEEATKNLMDDAERIAKLAITSGRIMTRNFRVAFSWTWQEPPVVVLSVFYRMLDNSMKRDDFRPVKSGQAWLWQKKEDAVAC